MSDPEKKRVRGSFDTIATKYDDWYLTPLGEYAEKCEMDAVVPALGVKEDDLVLDMGVGTGRYLPRMMDAECVTVGLDISTKMLSAALNRARRLMPVRITLLCADCETLPFRDRVFNRILSVTTLEFVPRPDKTLKELFEALREGGVLVLGVLGLTNPWAYKRMRKREQKETVWSYAHFFRPNELRRIVAERGFKVESLKGAVFAPPICPEGSLDIFSKFDRCLGRDILFRNFGAFLVLRGVKPR